MLRLRGRIPVTIYPTFWIFAALIGYLNSMSFLGTLIWVGIIFVSVLFHEYGHALTAALFGQSPRIELVALGGLTYHNGQNLPFWKQFFIVFNGPLFGFLLAILASLLLLSPLFSQGMVGSILSLTRMVNIFWTVVNLIPVMPLDGGQILRIVLEKIFGLKGFKYATLVSMLIALAISVVFFVTQAFLIGALFFLLAFQSYDTFRKTRHLSETDRDDTLRERLERVEEMMQTGQRQEAEQLCQEICSQAKKGMIYELSTQYLALLAYEKGDSKRAYDLLCSVQDALGGDALCVLHKVAFDQKDFSLVVQLAGACFQSRPTVDTALRNARAHAQMHQPLPTVGWLQTAMNEGLHNARKLFADDPFLDPIRSDASFQSLLASLGS